MGWEIFDVMGRNESKQVDSVKLTLMNVYEILDQSTFQSSGLPFDSKSLVGYYK